MCPLLRIFNPSVFNPPKNPRKPKTWTYEQANNRKEKAERAARDLQGDDERADEIAAMSVEAYAVERGKQIINPQLGGSMKRKVSAEEVRDNPVAAALNTAERALGKQQELYSQIRDLERQNEALQGRLDEIQDVLACEDSDCSAEDHLEEIDEIVEGGDDESGEDESGARRVAHAGGSHR